MSKFLMFIDDADDAACYSVEKLISMTCAADGVLLLHFESSLGWSDDGDLVTLTITADKEFEVMNAITEDIHKNKGIITTIANDIKAAATGEIEIIDLGSNTTDINHLHGTNGFTLISTDTTSKEYIFDKNNALGATGTVHADGVVIQVNGMSSASDVANQVETAIEHANGHAGKILVNRLNNVLSLTQNVAGAAGNTNISVGSLPNNSTSATATITITDLTELNAGDKVNLVATDGTNYDFVQGDQSSVNGTFEATTSNDQTATNLMNVINTSSGPSRDNFTATVDGAVVTVTQAIIGVDGNTTVTITDSGSAGMTKTDFLGTVAKYLWPIRNINAVHLTSGTQIKFYLAANNDAGEAYQIDDIVTVTCATHTAPAVYTSIVKQISAEKNETIISALYDSNIISVTYATGA